MQHIEIRVPLALANHFLELAEQCSDRMGNAGCNDFPMDDTPENRLLFDMCEASNHNMTLDEYRESEEYVGPNIHAGKIYATDWAVFELFKSYVLLGIAGRDGK